MTSDRVPTPLNDSERVAALRALDLLDTPPEPEFDRITRVAAAVMRTPVALVSLVDEKRQWFKSCHGLSLESSPRELAFCAHAIMRDEALVVLDATEDPRFKDNPFVTGEAHLRYYVGAPLITRDGFRLGTLCVLDTAARTEIPLEALSALKDLAAMTVAAIEGRKTLRHTADIVSQQLSVAAVQAEAGEQAKANLMAMLSHELRTPLNAILGFTEVMRGQLFGPLGSPKYLEYAQHIGDSGEHLLSLIGTLLNFASCDRGEIVLNDDLLDLGQVVEGCAGMMSERARLAGVELAPAVAPDLPALRGDRNQVVQMLLNLIGNAIKFNRPNGEVRISADLSGNQIVLTVADTGIGIPAERLDRTRQAFDQLESGLARRFEGLGLGLPLTERLIEMHGGELGLRSIEGQGTVATLTFPDWRTAATSAVA